MPYHLESHGSDKAMRCAACGGKFGLVRYYSWRTLLCSRKCVDRFKARRQSDYNWIFGSKSLSTSRPQSA
jgi:hypothetical protein